MNHTARTKKDNTKPASISNLTNQSYAQTYINWTWNDPKDPDFNYVRVYINGIQKPNVQKGKQFYNATNLLPNTRYNISTRTVDTSGNVNLTWLNHSAWTR